MKVFDKGTIEGFAHSVDDEVVNRSIVESIQLISVVLEDLKKNNSYINTQCEFMLVNEFKSGAVLPNSVLEIFVAINAPQIELNTIKLTKNAWYSFKNRIKNLSFFF